MILVDTSVWLDHFRAADPTLIDLLATDQVLSHPMVIGEIAVGSLRRRDAILDALQQLPLPVITSHAEVLHFISAYTLFGIGIGYIDAHLLASVRLTANASLWTRDRRLRDAAQSLSLAAVHS